MKTRIMAYLFLCSLVVYAGSASASFESGSNNYFGAGTGGAGGSDNSFFGAYAGDVNTGNNNTFIGEHSGYHNTTGFWNAFLGVSSGYYNTTGYDNTFIGRSSGATNTTASENTFIGAASGFNNTTGYDNTFIGSDSGYTNDTGRLNTFSGFSAGYSNTEGNWNTFVGGNAGYSNTTGYNNTFHGYAAGYTHTTGNFNTFLGYAAGYSNSTGSANVFLGSSAGANETGSNRLYIDNSSTAIPLIYGEFDNDIVAINGSLGIGTATPNAKLEVNGDVVLTDGTRKIIIIGGDSTGTEGGRIELQGAGSYPQQIIDSYQGDLRISNYYTAWHNKLRIFNVDPTYEMGLYVEGNVGIGTISPAEKLSVAGVIESTNGGIKFPDASTLTSANTINADTLDGLHSSAFALAAHVHSGNDITSGTVGEAYLDALIARDSEIMPTVFANDGSASTLDADLLDGQDSSAFMSASTDNWVNTSGDTMTGNLIVGGDVVIDYDLYVTGNTYVDSDKNLKKDIKPIESSLNKILGIEGVAYKWKRDNDNSNRKHYGVIAQQVEKVLPEVVRKSDDEIRKVAYMELIPVLIEAVKEQQEIITELSAKVQDLEKELTLRDNLAMAEID